MIGGRWLLALALVSAVLLPSVVPAVPRSREHRVHPGDVQTLPSYVRRVLPSVVNLRTRAPEDSPTAERLGARRSGSAIVFDPRGYAVTVSYLLLDAVAIEARTHDGRTVPARRVAIDYTTGLGIVKLEGGDGWPAAPLGQSREVAVGMLTGTVGLDEGGDLVAVTGQVHSIQRFSGSWEYMLDRAIIVAPVSPSWGGSALVDDHGRVIGIVSLRLGDGPHVNLAIPVDLLLAVKDELIAAGRVASRRPRPWLGLYTVPLDDGGLVVEGLSRSGPARAAGLRPGDRILRVNGVKVGSREEFYEQLWRGQAGDLIEVEVLRDDATRVIPVRSVDRGSLDRATAR
jgi:S1-C subfamily serine protease